MGTADAILDLVSSGTTLRENSLKQIEGGLVLKSQVFIFFSLCTFKGLSFLVFNSHIVS